VGGKLTGSGGEFEMKELQEGVQNLKLGWLVLMFLI
jgi:hypothetical protein